MERQNPASKICGEEIPHLIQWAAARVRHSVILFLPQGGASVLLSVCGSFGQMKTAGVFMVAHLLWESRYTSPNGDKLLRLTRSSALRFVDRLDGCSNPATFVAEAWGCKPATRGCNLNGKVANTWHSPPWSHGATEEVRLGLTPTQINRWTRRHEILRECLDKANPHAAIVRETLALTKPGPGFESSVKLLTKPGEREAVEKYRHHPINMNVTRDGDVQSNVSRLPEIARASLHIESMPVAEFDVKLAHAVLLGIFYEGETGDDWLEEKARFNEEALRGFPSVYGEGKAWKVEFLASLNQSTRVARHASEGYRQLERLFPLLAGKLARMKAVNRKAVGRRLRVTLAEIVRDMLIENGKDGIRSIPVVDSAVVAIPEGAFDKHRAAFRTAYRLGVPIAEKTGVAPLIEGSNGEKFRFFV
jgi:hypothetical protein